MWAPQASTRAYQSPPDVPSHTLPSKAWLLVSLETAAATLLSPEVSCGGGTFNLQMCTLPGPARGGGGGGTVSVAQNRALLVSWK